MRRPAPESPLLYRLSYPVMRLRAYTFEIPTSSASGDPRRIARPLPDPWIIEDLVEVS